MYFLSNPQNMSSGLLSVLSAQWEFQYNQVWDTTYAQVVTKIQEDRNGIEAEMCMHKECNLHKFIQAL